MDRVCFFGAPRAMNICPVMIITCVRRMPNKEKHVGRRPTGSIVWPVFWCKSKWNGVGYADICDSWDNDDHINDDGTNFGP